jgi:hypothetical protein
VQYGCTSESRWSRYTRLAALKHHLAAIAIVLDFVNPMLPLWRLFDRGCKRTARHSGPNVTSPPNLRILILSAHRADIAGVDPTHFRLRRVGHSHPTILAPDYPKFDALSHYAYSWR